MGVLRVTILIGINFSRKKSMKSINKLQRLGIFVLITILTVACSSSSHEGTFSVSGKLEGLGAPYFMCAVEYYTDSIAVDTVRLNANGEFNYRATVDGLTKVSLYFSGSQLSPLFVDQNTEIEIEGNVSDVYSLKIKGGEINDAIQAFRGRNRKLIETNSPLLQDSALAYAKNNKESVTSLALIDLYLKGRLAPSKLDSLIHTMSESLLELSYTKNILFDISEERRAEVGSSAPDFNLKNIKGKQIKLSDYAKKSVFLTFVEKEDSVMLSLYSDIEKESPSLSIVPFITETDKSTFGEMKRAYLFDKKGWASDLISNYNIKSVPYYVLIDSTKRVKSRGVLDKEVIKILKSLSGDKN